jgi:hypothetical protein
MAGGDHGHRSNPLLQPGKEAPRVRGTVQEHSMTAAHLQAQTGVGRWGGGGSRQQALLAPSDAALDGDTHEHCPTVLEYGSRCTTNLT